MTIISHRLGFAFFRVPKTGSSAADFVLQDSGAFDVDDIMSDRVRDHDLGLRRHTTPWQACQLGLITHEQLLEYRCFAFVRDPFERYFSAANHGLTDSEMKHQVDFFVPGVEVLNYHDFDNEVQKMLSVLGKRYGKIPKVNVRDQRFTKEEFWTEDRVTHLRNHFMDDIVFYANYRRKKNALPVTGSTSGRLRRPDPGERPASGGREATQAAAS